ncbi:MAG: hypothetical protein IJW98_05065 [Clostridia bacterium]|nr:hypothetical protein [Clostridia bacterium]
MKKLLSVLLTVAMLVTMSAFAVSADAVMGTWTKVSDTEYSVENHQNGNDYFDYYELGKNAEVTLSSEITIVDGAQQAYLFGVNDVNADGQIREAQDQYYLVCFIWGGQIGIERNDKGWGGWAKEGHTGFNPGDTFTLKVSFKNGYIKIYANDNLVLEYADSNPWANATGFGLASKAGPKVTFSNVAVDTTTPVVNTLGSGSIDVANAENNAKWTVEGNKYTLNIATPEEGYGNARFASYALGNSDKKVTVTGKYTFNEFCKWGPDHGGDNGFLFAIADKNGDGKVTEGGDFYYLIDIRTDGTAAIEKNQGGWGGWAKESGALNLEVGKEYTVSASYDPATGTIVVTVDGTEVINWTDPNPLTGTGYAIASKTPNFVMSDVAVVDEAAVCEHANTEITGKVDATVEAEGYTGDKVCSDCGETLEVGTTIPKLNPPATEPVKPAPTGDVAAVASALAILAVIGTAVVVTKKREF